MRKFILDCDPGMDDLLALSYLFKKKIPLLGITTVSGNSSIEAVTLNALRIKTVYQSPVKIYKGASQPLVGKATYAPEIHGEDGSRGILSGIEPMAQAEAQKAHQFIIQSVLENKHEVELIAVGPLTNVALAMVERPEICQYIKHIYIMGGGHVTGNVTPAAEFNIYADAHAAKVVFESGVPLTMVGLDATMKHGLTEQDVLDITAQASVTPENEMAKKLMLQLLEVSRLFGEDAAYIHDLVTVLAALDEEVIETRHYFVGIETKGKYTFGKTVVDIDGVLHKQPNAHVAFDLNADKLFEAVKDLVR